MAFQFGIFPPDGLNGPFALRLVTAIFALEVLVTPIGERVMSLPSHSFALSVEQSASLLQRGGGCDFFRYRMRGRVSPISYRILLGCVFSPLPWGERARVRGTNENQHSLWLVRAPPEGWSIRSSATGHRPKVGPLQERRDIFKFL